MYVSFKSDLSLNNSILISASIAAFSAVSLTWSHYFDALFNNYFKNVTVNTLHLNWNASEPFNNYIDLPAITILIIVFIISFFGIEFTAFFSNILAVVNTLVLSTLTIFGFIYGKSQNLLQNPYQNGVHGIVKGAGIILYAYMGFESSTCATTEAKNPSRDVPLSMIISLSLICVLYSSVSFSLNFMQNYTEIDKNAPFPTAFQNIKWMHTVASIGPVFSLTGTLLTSVFGFGRVIYAMANDGLFFKSLSIVHKKFKIPHFAFLFGFIFAVILLITLDLKDLLGFADICGFLAYVLVSTALLVVRYSPTSERFQVINEDEEEEEEEEETVFMDRRTLLLEEISEPLLSEFDDPELKISSRRRQREPNKKRCFRYSKQKKLSSIIIIFVFILNIFLSGLFNYTKNFEVLLIVLIVLFNLIASFLLILFCEQVQDQQKIAFKLPFVPFLPIASMSLNIFLMMSSAFKDWIVFFTIVIIGFPIYFFYGIRNSKLAA